MTAAKRAWEAATLVVTLSVLALSGVLLNWGVEYYKVLALNIIVFSCYLYVVYKRYHVEMVPEKDLALFDDPDDLRILCDIYGLSTSGGPIILKQRLKDFSRKNRESSFVWVAPRAVHSLRSALEVNMAPEEPPRASDEPKKVSELVMEMISVGPSRKAPSGMLVGGTSRSSARLATIGSCPVCESKLPKGSAACPACGADLEFYAVLSESKLGKLLLAEKAEARRRKLRYPVSPPRDA
jgi:hypothetical protein